MGKRIRIRTAIVTAIVGSLVAVSPAIAVPQEQAKDVKVAQYPSIPQPSTGSFDWAQRARDYDAFVYDWTDRGVYSTIREDATALNMEDGETTYKMPAYYGDSRTIAESGDGSQEAVTQIASVVGATLVGIDKSNQDGYNYVDMLRTFYHPETGIAMNTPAGEDNSPGSKSIWYTTTANVLYYMMGSLYPNATDMDTILRSIADQYYEMLEALGKSNANLDFQDYDFANETVTKGRLEGGEAAAGAAAILLWANSKFGDAKYLEGAIWAMDSLENAGKNLYYEVLVLFAPYIAARLNATENTDYDVSMYLNWLMGGSSARRSWGTLADTWGGIDVYGLSGSLTDCGPKGCGDGKSGYAFAMNSFATPLLAATAKYDSRYANVIGKWMANVNHAARYFYADQMSADQQYWGDRFINDEANVIAYEGLTSSGNAGIMALGDVPDRSTNWGVGSDATSLGLYGSSWVGFMGAALSDTGTENVIGVDLNVLDFFGDNYYPTSLYYNGNSDDAEVTVNVGESPVGLYDSVSDTVIADGVSGQVNISVPGEGSVVLVTIPSGATRVEKGNEVTFDGLPAGWNRNTDRDIARDAVSVVASSTKDGFDANSVIDGTPETMWESSEVDNQTVTVDLGKITDVAEVQLLWGPMAAKDFTISVSSDNQTWIDIATQTEGFGKRSKVSFVPTRAQYVKLSLDEPVVPGASGYSLRSFEVRQVSDNPDLALGKTANASSVQNSNQNLPAAVTDGDPLTRWESATSDPQWIQIDLGESQQIGSVVVAWEKAAAKEYQISVSDDAKEWAVVEHGENAYSPITVTSDLPQGTSGRYLRVTGTSRLTKYAYSIYSISVYGPGKVETVNPDGSAEAKQPSISVGASETGKERATTQKKTAYLVKGQGYSPNAEVTNNWTCTGEEIGTDTIIADPEGAYSYEILVSASNSCSLRATDTYGASATLGDIEFKVDATEEEKPESGGGESGGGESGGSESGGSESGGSESGGSEKGRTDAEPQTDLAITGSTALIIGLLSVVLLVVGGLALLTRYKRIERG